MPDLASYDAIGFDIDSLIVYDRVKLTKHIVKSILSSLHENFQGYPSEI